MIIPVPTYREEVVERAPVVAPNQERDRWTLWYMDCPSWKCTCGLTNFGRNEQCAKWTCKLPRPDWYKENVYGQT
jgi:hypothetical protein